MKRRRGGQPGNQNAKGNCGNRRARGKPGNRGGGAPAGNQNARRRSKTVLEFLRREYRHLPEADVWLLQNAEALNRANLHDDEQRDAALFAAFGGMTPEELAAQGREFRLGLYAMPDERWLDGDRAEDDLAA